MNSASRRPRRLIEVDLPIRTISAQAGREKSIRHGHLSTLHMWWARRPLAACRSVVLGALLPDPADSECSPTFRREAAGLLAKLRDRMGGAERDLADPLQLRRALLDFIGTVSSWEATREPLLVQTSQELCAAAYRDLGSVHGDRPTVLDPFAGGGAIPLEAVRMGARAHASDLNPIPVLLNTVLLEYVPRFGTSLAEAVRSEGAALKARASKALSQFYPGDPDGSAPLAYLWARTIRCEAPGCGAEIPLLRSMWLAKKGKKAVALRMRVDRKQRTIGWDVVEGAEVDPKLAGRGTIVRGAATCPACDFTMKVDRVRAQLRGRHGGTQDARMMAVVIARSGVPGRRYRLPTERDLAAVARASSAAQEMRDVRTVAGMRLIPDESTEHYHSFVNRGPIYGMTSWEDYFTARQQLALGTMIQLLRDVSLQESKLASAVKTCLALALSRQVDATSSLCRWHTTGEKHTATFGRQALPMVWDFSEVNVLSEATGGFEGAVEWVARVIDENTRIPPDRAQVALASAMQLPLPDDSVDAVVTDPPYYYSVQYADLADFFYVWMRRSIGDLYPALFDSPLISKEEEIIVQSPGHEFARDGKNNAFYEASMSRALSEARRALAPNGVAVVVFAHKSTRGWEALLQALVNAGWTITASWPIDTEMAARVIAQGRAVLASSIHLVCRPREDEHGRVQDSVGSWRLVLEELPVRIREWLVRLAEERVVGADALFACLGPALEIFTRYARVEKVSGEQVLLREYLEQVWAAVSREALAQMFADADAAGLEDDGRLTAMWLWTLASPESEQETSVRQDEEEGGGDGGDGGDEDDDGEASSSRETSAYALEYDAARKIAQSLGIHLEQMAKVVEVSGSMARLRSVAERAEDLFGNPGGAPRAARKSARRKQTALFEELGEKLASEISPRMDVTTLERVQQSMLLFALGQADALRRYLVEDGVGTQVRFWKLAQALSVLYPGSSDERRWIHGVLARKKGLGF